MTSRSRDALSPEAVAGLRHELRTPVNHILGYCEMLLEDAEEAGLDHWRPALQESIASARDILNLIGTMLPAGEVELSPVAVERLTGALRGPQRRIVTAMAVLLETDDDRVGELAADARRVVQAAESLLALGEALAGDSERGELEAEPRQVSEGRRDQRVPSAGAGRSADGRPAVAPSADEAAGAAAAPSGPAGASREDPGQSRILVVDDNPENREILERRLVRQGYAVESAENGDLALRMIGEHRYDLVLLDIMMPEVDGYEVLQRVKSDARMRDIPVIMISALDDIGSIVRCIERGAEDYLPKPFDPVLLKARISASLEKKRLRDMEVEYLDQVKRVIEAASAVEAGSYEAGALSPIAVREDELGRLARVFDAMAGQVKAREETLRQQVGDLRRAIERAQQSASAPVEVERSAELEVGELLADRYEIVKVIDAGGMGMVYKARDRELDDDIAIKTLHSDLISDDESLIERFKSEIRLARMISHPSVVRTHDFGRWAGIYYLTMELVEGVTARQLIDKQGRLGVPSTLAIATQLARSLEVAHAKGVIHRDIKPQNLLLDANGTLKVLDFGVACLTERKGDLTQAGMVVGTPAYMAPEQLLEETVEERSDLYAVGVVMYECLTGLLPFQASSTVALIAKLLRDEPTPPDQLSDDVPPPLSRLIMRLLSKDLEERPASAKELGDLLAQIR